MKLGLCQILNFMLHCDKINVDLDDVALAIFTRYRHRSVRPRFKVYTVVLILDSPLELSL